MKGKHLVILLAILLIGCNGQSPGQNKNSAEESITILNDIITIF